MPCWVGALHAGRNTDSRVDSNECATRGIRGRRARRKRSSHTRRAGLFDAASARNAAMGESAQECGTGRRNRRVEWGNHWISIACAVESFGIALVIYENWVPLELVIVLGGVVGGVCGVF